MTRAVGYLRLVGALAIFLGAFVAPAAAQNSIGIRFASYGSGADRNQITLFLQDKCGRGPDCQFVVESQQFPEGLWNRGGKSAPDLWAQFKCRPNGNLCSFHTHWNGNVIQMACRGGIASVAGSDESGGGCAMGKTQIGKFPTPPRRKKK